MEGGNQRPRWSMPPEMKEEFLQMMRDAAERSGIPYEEVVKTFTADLRRETAILRTATKLNESDAVTRLMADLSDSTQKQ